MQAGTWFHKEAPRQREIRGNRLTADEFKEPVELSSGQIPALGDDARWVETSTNGDVGVVSRRRRPDKR